MEIVVNILGYNITYLELIGSIFNFLSVILATRANLWNWVVSFVTQICFFFLFWYIGLYANILLQIYFTYICIISIFRWKKTDNEDDKGLEWMTNSKRIVTFLNTIIFIGIGWMILSNIHLVFPSLKSEYPLMDVTIMVSSVVGVNMLSKKYIESWIVWIFNDIVCIALFFLSGIYIIGIEYFVITGIAIYGLINWIKIKNGKNKKIRTIEIT